MQSPKNPMTDKNRLTPLLVSIGVVVGILIGSFFANHFSSLRLQLVGGSSNKIADLFHLIDDQYVDSVRLADLVERSLPSILRELDPHSTYIPADEVEASMQDLNGSFSGIGVQFTIYKDTVRIVKVLPGGPAEGVGMQAGDRIVRVDGKDYVGPDVVTNDSTMKLLKGPKGTDVRVDVRRAGEKKPISFHIVRGDVPVSTVDAVFMLAPKVGYIRITAFGETTYSEFISALAALRAEGFERLVIDLRANGGGYMESAVRIANEFLSKGSTIVYTKGAHSARRDYRADGSGAYQRLPLVVLVDEFSASASEIFAGAMQDNDRAAIIGRRTFGKGLVQVPIEFRDGSMLRLTTARYYTPADRCVQKPYVPGESQEYEADLVLRAERGEFDTPDSLQFTGPEFKTLAGRTVYGGGGISPDIFIPRDTTGFTPYFSEAYMGGLLNAFAYDFVDRHRAELAVCETLPELEKRLARYDLVDAFATYAAREGLKRRNLQIRQSHTLLKQRLTAYIVSDVLSISEAAQYIAQSDPATLRALAEFNK